MGKESIETFDSLTLPIRNFVAWATGLPETVSEWVLLKDEELLHIKLSIGKYLSNNAYCQQLEHWSNLLNNITNEKIEDAFLYDCC
jgi:outer membrane biogenesis lipoprotein LolB